ncbi:MAG: hypothetical protein HYU84_06960 [Chloroflexi bacterium]|nr:hypothetical protein [Chloroflexota bacterium]
MEKIEIVTRSILERQRITAFEDKSVVVYNNLVGEYRVEYKYNDLKSRITRGKSGDSEWTNIGYFFLSIMFVSTFILALIFPEYLERPLYKMLPTGLAVLSLIAFSLRLVKYEKIWIYGKDNNVACMIKLTKDSRERGENITGYILDRIENTGSEKTE